MDQFYSNRSTKIGETEERNRENEKSNIDILKDANKSTINPFAKVCDHVDLSLEMKDKGGVDKSRFRSILIKWKNDWKLEE